MSWDAAALTWQMHSRVQVYPTFLVIDGKLIAHRFGTLLAAPPRLLGGPEQVVNIGHLTVYGRIRL